MPSEQPLTGDTPSVTDLVDTLRDRFERAWRGGDAPTLAPFLPADGPVRAAALVPLLCIDLEMRLRRRAPTFPGPVLCQAGQVGDGQRRLADEGGGVGRRSVGQGAPVPVRCRGGGGTGQTPRTTAVAPAPGLRYSQQR
jgi:hypothetical protein